MSRVARMFRVGSPLTSRRSARIPGAMTPRSLSWKIRAGTAVAAARAAVGGSPASTRSSSSRWGVAPGAVPGLGGGAAAARVAGVGRAAPRGARHGARRELGHGDPGAAALQRIGEADLEDLDV